MTTTDLYAPVTDAILRLFLKYEPDAYNALADFVRRNLGIWLSGISNPKGLNNVAADIFTWAESRGNIDLLIARLHQHDPADAVLAVLVTERGLDVSSFAAVQATDYKALQAVAANPVTRAMLEPYRLDLQQLCLTAVRIGGWKYLHDNVDLLRSLVLAPLTLILKGPPQPSQRLEAQKLSTELAKRTTLITSRIGEMKLKESAIPWLPKRLLPAQTSLQAALQTWPGIDDLAAAVSSLGIVTSSDLSVLNSNIKNVAATIEGLSLPEKLEALQASIAKGIADAKAAEQTNAEIRSMDQQVQQVIDLVDKHDPWQLLKDAFDNYTTVGSTAEARDSWRRVNSMIDAIIEPPEDLNMVGKSMVDALAADDFFTIQDMIGALNSVISNHFLAIDGDLLKAAEQLGEMGSGLGDVLEKFDG